MVSRAKLAALRKVASQQESPMARVALNDLANERAVRKQLQAAFEVSVRGHESTEKLLARIQHVANVSRTRAKTIATTERTKAANGARYAEVLNKYLREYDKAVKGHRARPAVPVFQWVNPRAAKEPRHEHVAISGDKREVGEYFLPGLRYPGDPQAPAHQVINCHCYIRQVSG